MASTRSSLAESNSYKTAIESIDTQENMVNNTTNNHHHYHNNNTTGSGEGPSLSALLDPKKLDYYLNFKENQAQQPKQSEIKSTKQLPDADQDRVSLTEKAEEIPNKRGLSRAVEVVKNPIASLNDVPNPLVAPPDETQQSASQERPTRKRFLQHLAKGGSSSNPPPEATEPTTPGFVESPSRSQSPTRPSIGRRTATKLAFPFSKGTKSRPNSGSEQQFLAVNSYAGPNGLGGSHSVPATPTDETGKHRFANTSKKLLKFRRKKGKHQINSKFGSAANRKAEHELDIKNQVKTEQLINSMVAGYPSAIMVSTYFINDELGQRHIPMLLPLLSLSVTDITTAKHTKKRRFQVDLEYGLGQNVLRWSLVKTLKELSGLHRNIKYQLISDNITKNVMNKGTQDSTISKDKVDYLLPEFPKFENATKRGLNRATTTRHDSMSTLPRQSLALDNRMQQQQQQQQPPPPPPPQQQQQQQNGWTTPSKKAQIPPPPPIALTQATNVDSTPAKPVAQLPPLPSPGTQSHPTRHRPSHSEPILHNSSDDEYDNFDDGASINSEVSKRHYFVNKVKNKLTSTINYAHVHHHHDQTNGALLSQQQTQPYSPEIAYQIKLQKYFDELLSRLALSPQANRIFQFFELSPVSVLLSNENVKKRKEGYLYVTTKAGDQGWRVGHLKAREWKAMVQRHSVKWFVVGHSYIMYVADINSTTPLDVFLVDSKFKFSLSGWSEQQHNNQHTLNNPHAGNDKVLAPVHEDDEDEDDPNANPTSKDEADGVLDNVAEQLTGNKYKIMKIENTERKLYVTHKSFEQLKKWGDVIKKMQDESIWSQPHRFDSFAPVRQNCFAQWFVDGRDYMWALSAALEMAKDVIYIHDWWLSPELYLRRPANGNQEWRIDRLLKRKAEQGVKIFVIVYRNVANTVITDSLWTKHSLLSLHENVYILRSPNQLMQNVYFWAHHEKLAIIDHSVCFVGGIDLCYGRFDTPDHVLADDAPYAFESQIPEDLSQEDRDALEFQKFPGKDYSNPRQKDFFDLDKPFVDMYDRLNVPRMPWHDVHMLTSGHIARDLSRHFTQRWNYILRQKRPSRPTPLLIPPRDFTDDEIQDLGLGGTCEIQLLRSSCDWSLGLQDHEQSIQNAYIKCIEVSEHFVYMENQFFVTSCDVDDVLVKNKIGDALVDRIIRAHDLRETWKCVIVIPLMPGFEAQVDSKEGSAVRVIMQCQYMSISMGDSSIFSKLRRVGIKPEDYIQFFSLRKWSYIGKNDLLVTEQLYIHAKTMIVDDRIAIIGSANINERSMRGTRDSEVCAMVRDKDMIDSKMDGKPYKVGKFAHTLRMRLMREHLGVDVDLFEMIERRFSQIEDFASHGKGLKASTLQNQEGDHMLAAKVELATRYLLHQEESFDDGTPIFKAMLKKPRGSGKQLTKAMFDSFDSLGADKNLDGIPFTYSFNHRAGEENVGIREKKSFSTDPRVTTQAHSEEIQGLTDKFTSKMYLDSKKRIEEAIKQFSSYTFGPNGLDKNLPDYEDVVDHLTHPAPANESIDNVNADRWIMIKKLFYIQKLVNKEALNHSKKKSPSSRDTATAVTTSAFNNSSQPSPNVIRSSEVPATPQFLSHQQSQQFSQLNSLEQPPNSGNGFPSASGSGSAGQGASSAVAAGITKTVHLTDVDIDHIDKITLPQTDFQFLDPFAFSDPLDIRFYEGLWMPQAMRNTMIYQMVFHCQPCDCVQMWKDYKAFEELRAAFSKNEQARCAIINNSNINGGGSGSGINGTGSTELNHAASSDFSNGQHQGSGTPNTTPLTNNHNGSDDVLELLDAYNANGESTPDLRNVVPQQQQQQQQNGNFDPNEINRINMRKSRMAQLERYQKTSASAAEDSDAAFNSKYGVVYDHETAEKLLGLVRGHLVQFPTRWLKKEVEGGNWFYKADKLPPVQIYN